MVIAGSGAPQQPRRGGGGVEAGAGEPSRASSRRRFWRPSSERPIRRGTADRSFRPACSPGKSTKSFPPCRTDRRRPSRSTRPRFRREQRPLAEVAQAARGLVAMGDVPIISRRPPTVFGCLSIACRKEPARAIFSAGSPSRGERRAAANVAVDGAGARAIEADGADPPQFAGDSDPGRGRSAAVRRLAGRSGQLVRTLDEGSGAEVLFQLGRRYYRQGAGRWPPRPSRCWPIAIRNIRWPERRWSGWYNIIPAARPPGETGKPIGSWHSKSTPWLRPRPVTKPARTREADRHHREGVGGAGPRSALGRIGQPGRPVHAAATSGQPGQEAGRSRRRAGGRAPSRLSAGDRPSPARLSAAGRAILFVAQRLERTMPGGPPPAARNGCRHGRVCPPNPWPVACRRPRSRGWMASWTTRCGRRIARWSCTAHGARTRPGRPWRCWPTTASFCIWPPVAGNRGDSAGGDRKESPARCRRQHAGPGRILHRSGSRLDDVLSPVGRSAGLHARPVLARRDLESALVRRRRSARRHLELRSGGAAGRADWRIAHRGPGLALGVVRIAPGVGLQSWSTPAGAEPWAKVLGCCCFNEAGFAKPAGEGISIRVGWFAAHQPERKRGNIVVGPSLARSG